MTNIHRCRANTRGMAASRLARLLCWLALALGGASALAVPTDMIVVLDNSGSMRQNDPAFRLKDAVAKFFGTLPADTRAGIVVFDSKANYTMPLAPIDAAAQGAVAASLGKIDYRGQHTNIPAAIERAIYELKSNARPEAAKVVVFETDGIIDTGNAAVDAEKAKWMREELAADAADNGIRVFGIAFTENADFFLIQSLAKKTSGEYFRAVAPEDLEGVFLKVQQRLAAPPPAPAQPVAPPPAAVAPPAATAPAASGAVSECLARRSDGDRAALEQMAKDTGMSADQLCAEMEAAPAGKAVVVPPPGAAAAPEAEGGGMNLGVIAGLVVAILAIGAAIFVVMRRRGGGAPAASPTVAVPRAAPAAPVSTPPVVPDAFIKDINGVTNEPAMQIGAKPLMIGRVAGSDADHLDYFVIDKPTIGRRHALIKYRDFCFWISDQGSVNGTFLNGERLDHERQLKHGDRVRFHKYDFEFSMPEMDSAGHTIFADPADRTMIGDTATMMGMATSAGGFSAAAAAGTAVTALKPPSPPPAPAPAPAAFAFDDDDEEDVTAMPDSDKTSLLAPVSMTEEAPDVFDPFGDAPPPAAEDGDFIALDGEGAAAAEEETYVPSIERAGLLSGTVARAEAEFDAEASAFFDEEELGITSTPLPGGAASVERGPELRLDGDFEDEPTMKIPAQGARFDPPLRDHVPLVDDEFTESETMVPVHPASAASDDYEPPEEATADISIDDFMRTDSFEAPVPGLADDDEDATLMPHQVPNRPVAIDDVFDVTAEGTIAPVNPGEDDDDDAPTRILR